MKKIEISISNPDFLRNQTPDHPSDQKRIDDLNALAVQKNFRVDAVKSWVVSAK